jgi:hypothetical protein
MANRVGYHEEETLPVDAMTASILYCRSHCAKPLLAAKEGLRHLEIHKKVRFF